MNVPMDSDITMIPGAEGQESETIPLGDEDTSGWWELSFSSWM